MNVPKSKTGWALLVVYCALSAFLLVQAFTCADWVCDLVAFPITIPFGLLLLAALHWLDPIFHFGSIAYAPFRDWLFIVPTVGVNALIYYWLGVGIERIVRRFRADGPR